MSRMSFRRRMVLLAAGAVAAAIVIASVIVYIVTRNELTGQLDASLRAKITPGRQFVKIETQHLGARELTRLTREGKLPAVALAAVPPGFGMLAKARGAIAVPGGALPLPASGGENAPAVASHTGAAAAQEGSISVQASGSSHARAGAPPREGGGAVSQETLMFGGHNHIVHTTSANAPIMAGQVRLVLQGPPVEGAAGYVQLSLADGEVLGSTSQSALPPSRHSAAPSRHSSPPSPGSLLPITATTRAVASGRHNAFFTDVDVHGTAVRVLTARAAQGAAWQVALPLADLHNTLDHLRLVLAIVVLGGIALAAALGLLVSRAALVPVRRLTGAAERVTRTQDLGHRIAPGGQDELGRLSASFNTMLAALERSRLAQRQLVSDASHELRTPLTSIQANLDALALGEQLPAEKRERVLAAAQAQLRELTVLVGDLVDLSKNEVEEIEIEDVRLDLAAAAAIERATLHAPQCRFELDAEPCLVRAAPARLDRAIANLLDNAVKWAPADPIEVRVRDGALEVRDHGPGIAEVDLPRVFDRFYRAPAARGRGGSGLGLAIVRQTAEIHGGAVHARNDPGGGARLTLELPPLAMTPAELARLDERLPAAGPAGGLSIA
jgi:two-component system sensor histidine kinase MprB